LPAWAGRDFESIRRGDVAALLDAVEDNAGQVAADRVLSIISKMTKWYAGRHETYQIPLVPGMRRSNPRERARDRILSDDEIRAIWPKATGTFGDMVKILLLTAQRREKVASMRWDEISAKGVWTVRNGNKRQKGTGGELVLPPLALDIINARPRFASNPHVFPGVGQSHFRSYYWHKLTLDRATGVTGWILHSPPHGSLVNVAGRRSLPHCRKSVGPRH
jgi:integrase